MAEQGLIELCVKAALAAKVDQAMTLSGALRPFNENERHQIARAAVRAVLEALREHGPNEAMIDAYFDRCRELGFTAHINATAAWEAFLTAALRSPPHV